MTNLSECVCFVCLQKIVTLYLILIVLQIAFYAQKKFRIGIMNNNIPSWVAPGATVYAWLSQMLDLLIVFDSLLSQNFALHHFLAGFV